MNTPEAEVLAAIARKVGRPIGVTMSDGWCTGLDLTSGDYIYHGLIRHHSTAEKQAILGLICRLRRLRRLNLRRNRLGALPDALRELQELEELTLGSNDLGVVPEPIRHLRRLRYLHLGNNGLTEVPAWLAELTSLEYLALHKNIRLKSIAPVAGLRQLRHLNLHYLNLHRLPDFIWQLRELITLTVWNIGSLPEEMANLRQLEFFSDCGCPSLRELPEVLTQLPRLRMMRLFQNSLESLPEEIGRLEHLEQLSLYQNRLSHLPESFARLKRLRKLNLACNRFVEVPALLAHCESLEWLAIFENPISLKPETALPLPPKTVVLDEWPFTSGPEVRIAA